MDDTTPAPISNNMDNVNGGAKRKRSVSGEPHTAAAPPAKTAKVNSHLQINYLVRQYNDVLPLVSAEDTLPTIVQTLNDYAGVLERHESLAGNLGARPLGPILIKRFERLFDGAPRVLKSHGKEGTTVTWLDVVEFARHKPEQFNLEKMRDGVRVCQFYTKQSRVEISEEDYMLIKSGMPQKLIPPQPIPEDEEKELGTLEIMEKSIAQVVILADQVSARARQTKHRLISRKTAIASRREAEAAEAARPDSEGKDNESPSGFTAVNSLRVKDHPLLSGVSNGKTYTGPAASPTTRAELLTCFTQNRERIVDQPSGDYTPNQPFRNTGSSKSKSKTQSDNIDYAGILLNSASPVPIPTTPVSLLNYPRPMQPERYDDSGPFKAEMLARMDSMARGDRVMPPCDRCRRLHMDCLKNLTACLGCTKKHAKCSWKDVTQQELDDNPHPRQKDGSVASNDDNRDTTTEKTHDPEQPVRDEELLGDDDSDDDEPAQSHNHPLVAAQIDGASDSPDVHMGNSGAAEPVKAVAPEAPMGEASSNNLASQLQEAAQDTVKRRLGDDGLGALGRADEAVSGGTVPEPTKSSLFPSTQGFASDIVGKREGGASDYGTEVKTGGFASVNGAQAI